MLPSCWFGYKPVELVFKLPAADKGIQKLFAEAHGKYDDEKWLEIMINEMCVFEEVDVCVIRTCQKLKIHKDQIGFGLN